MSLIVSRVMCRVVLLFVAQLLIGGVAKANCLPPFEIKSEERVCQKHSDCVFVGDSCRSCGDAHYANQKFKTNIEARDLASREKAKCVLACEACGKWAKVGECREGICGPSQGAPQEKTSGVSPSILPGKILGKSRSTNRKPSFFSAEIQNPKCYLPEPATIADWTAALPAEVSEQELVTRLVYAETLATNCFSEKYKGLSDEISAGIAAVIYNRVLRAQESAALARRFGKGIHGVVFQKSQFNSSLSTKYSLSQWKEFLCPTKPDLWIGAVRKTQEIFSGDQDPFADTTVTSVYYYRHFDSKPVEKRPPLPNWAKENSSHRVQMKSVDSAKNKSLKDCIGFFSEG